jgi:hypothetical protein
MNFIIASNTENYKDIIKYVVFGRLTIPEELIVKYNDETNTINYTYEFYKECNGDITNKIIKVKYEDFKVTKIKVYVISPSCAL